jgi:hypothetical protein
VRNISSATDSSRSLYTAYDAPFPEARDFSKFVASLWRPYIHSLENDTLVTQDGREYHVDPTQRIWDKPLGKDVLILNIDTRYDDSSEEEHLNPRRAGWLNHYIYCSTHQPTFIEDYR